jgi:hypothetical protein
MTGSVEMTGGRGGMTRKGSSSPGNANLRIGTQAGYDESSPSDPLRKYALRHTPSVIPVHAAVTSAPGVIPAQAGILTRVALYEGPTVVENYAGIPSRHISYGKCGELCVLQSLVWIRAI